MKRPFYIDKEIWDDMKWKEQDFIIFLREKRYTKEQIKRNLYITSDVWFWKLRKRVLAKINKVNKIDN